MGPATGPPPGVTLVACCCSEQRDSPRGQHGLLGRASPAEMMTPCPPLEESRLQQIKPLPST